jgi:hypothetical protein
MATTPAVRALSGILFVLIIVGAAFWLGCGGGEKPSTMSGKPTPTSNVPELPQMDPACPTGDPPKTLEQLNKCTAHLDFEEEPIFGDEQRLMVFDPGEGPGCPGARTIHNCRLGPLAQIQPEKHSHLWPDTLVQREGRIIAKLFVKKGEKEYRKLNLLPGHNTYWWVQIDSGGKGGRSFFVSDSVVAGNLVTIKRDSLVVERYRGGPLSHALARWLWLAEDETGKGSCTQTSTCH